MTRRILIIEDEDLIAECMKLILESEGHSVLHSNNGREALDLLDQLDQHFLPELIFCDMMMPVLDGFGFMREYLGRAGSHAPVIATSSFAPYLNEAASLGASAVLSKPFEVDDFIALVNAHLAGIPYMASTPSEASSILAEEVSRAQAAGRACLYLDKNRGRLDNAVKHIAAVFKVPICMISIVTEDRLEWPASVGLPDELAMEGGIERKSSFCTHAVEAHRPLVVSNVAENPFFSKVSEIRAFGIAFYAGVPILDRSQKILGTVCLMDRVPRAFDALDLSLLEKLAMRVEAELNWDEARRSPGEPESSFPNLGCFDPVLEVYGADAFLAIANRQAFRHAARGVPLSLAMLEVNPGRRVGLLTEMKDYQESACIGRASRDRFAWLVPEVDVMTLRSWLNAREGLVVIGSILDLMRYPGSAAFASWNGEKKLKNPAA